MAEKERNGFAIGLVGLGVMGRNFLLNIADHGFPAAGYDKDESQVQALRQASAGRDDVLGARDLQSFLGSLSKPRNVIMLVPAGPPVDSVLRDLLPHLERNDLIIDGGNSYFKDTEVRSGTVTERGMHYLGVGISGGEHGARYGPSIMPGGSREAYDRVKPLFEAAAAHVDGDPCVTWLGPRSAGHYVKMVHNGIEYGVMQLIAETYDLLARGLGLSDDELHEVYDSWNRRPEMSSYLLEITARIFSEQDEKTGKRLVDVILDEAKQKGTGAWTSEEAMALQEATPTINTAVSMRSLSVLKEERQRAARLYQRESQPYGGDRRQFLEQLRDAFYSAMILTYSQGMTLLRTASQKYDFGLNLESVARIWRGGCIIRAALLEKMRAAYRSHPHLHSLLLDESLGREAAANQEAMRSVAGAALRFGIPAPAFMAALAYFDAYRSPRLPANLTQAQRDYFGSHTYERVDAKGSFHTHWE